MTTTTDSPTAPFVSARDLAARWGVHLKTARNRTREEGFSTMFELGPRSHRWSTAEVDEWEQGTRRKARRVHTGLPQHRGVTLPAGVVLRRAA